MKAPTLILTRFAYSPMGTFSKYFLRGIEYYTVERPWLDNQVSISCIPTGTYTCTPRRYNRGDYDAIEVLNVPGRTHILWHKGNTMMDSKGCILPGCGLSWIGSSWAVSESGIAFEQLMAEYGRQNFTLHIDNLITGEG